MEKLLLLLLLLFCAEAKHLISVDLNVSQTQLNLHLVPLDLQTCWRPAGLEAKENAVPRGKDISNVLKEEHFVAEQVWEVTKPVFNYLEVNVLQ